MYDHILSSLVDVSKQLSVEIVQQFIQVSSKLPWSCPQFFLFLIQHPTLHLSILTQTILGDEVGKLILLNHFNYPGNKFKVIDVPLYRITARNHFISLSLHEASHPNMLRSPKHLDK
jgi:hypothetical protein